MLLAFANTNMFHVQVGSELSLHPDDVIMTSCEVLMRRIDVNATLFRRNVSAGLVAVEI